MTNKVTKEQFEAIAAIVGDKSVKPQRAASYAEKTKLYGLYKRATLGRLLAPFEEGEDVDTDSRPKSRPGMLFVEARAKYDAWQGCQEMDKQEAMNEYAKIATDTVGAKVSDILKA